MGQELKFFPSDLDCVWNETEKMYVRWKWKLWLHVTHRHTHTHTSIDTQTKRLHDTILHGDRTLIKRAVCYVIHLGAPEWKYVNQLFLCSQYTNTHTVWKVKNCVQGKSSRGSSRKKSCAALKIWMNFTTSVCVSMRENRARTKFNDKLLNALADKFSLKNCCTVLRPSPGSLV